MNHESISVKYFIISKLRKFSPVKLSLSKVVLSRFNLTIIIFDSFHADLNLPPFHASRLFCVFHFFITH